MKVCKLCGSTYGDRVDFCFRDGQPLVAQEAEGPAGAPPPRHAPGLADMLDVPEPGFVQRPPGPAPADPTSLPSPSGLADAGDVPATPTAVEAERPPAAEPVAAAADLVEDLPPPAVLDPPAMDGGVGDLVDLPAEDGPAVPAGDDSAPPPPSGVAPSPFATEQDTTAAGLSDVVAPPVEIDDEEALPGPKEIDDGLDPDALADIARTLSTPAAPVSDAAPAPVQHDGAPALDELVTETPVSHDADDDIVSYIGAGGDTAGNDDFEDGEPARSNDNKLVLVLFAAAILLAVLAGGFLLMNRSGPDADPLAGKPEEVATPVVEAPAPPPATRPEAPGEPGAETDAENAGDAVADADGGGRTRTAPAQADHADAPEAQAARTDAAGAADRARADDATPTDATATSAPTGVTSASSTSASTTARASATAASSSGAAGTASPPADAAATAAGGPADDAASAGSADGTADVSTDSPWQSEVSSGRLTINTVPSGAQVFIDGRAYGSSPLSAELDYGMHTIRVSLGGYTSESRTIDVEVAEMAVPFELKPLVVTGTVNIFGPTGSTVLVDGTQVGKIPTSVTLTEGTHNFRVETTEGTSFTRAQDIRFDSGTTVSVTLSP